MIYSTESIAMPPRVIMHIRTMYERAQVILEYGSGGSTLFAARQPGKHVFAQACLRRGERCSLSLPAQHPTHAVAHGHTGGDALFRHRAGQGLGTAGG